LPEILTFLSLIFETLKIPLFFAPSISNSLKRFHESQNIFNTEKLIRGLDCEDRKRNNYKLAQKFL
jgi:hypothetical protein